MDSREEIKLLAPKLSQWEREEAYEVPTNYFATVADRVLDKVSEETEMEAYFEALPQKVLQKINDENKKKKTNIISLVKYGIAALFLISIGTMMWNTETTQNTYASTIESEELDYIIDHATVSDLLEADFITDELLDDLAINQDDDIESTLEEYILNSDDELLEELL